jgi:hypothetical protein
VEQVLGRQCSVIARSRTLSENYRTCSALVALVALVALLAGCSMQSVGARTQASPIPSSRRDQVQQNPNGPGNGRSPLSKSLLNRGNLPELRQLSSPVYTLKSICMSAGFSDARSGASVRFERQSGGFVLSEGITKFGSSKAAEAAIRILRERSSTAGCRRVRSVYHLGVRRKSIGIRGSVATRLIERPPSGATRTIYVSYDRVSDLVLEVDVEGTRASLRRLTEADQIAIRKLESRQPKAA